MGKGWQHFKTITKHRHLVRKHCFKIGLYRQGLMHDLSKYSLTEFETGRKYYVGTRSPNAVEREKTGISKAWLHHKGRNKHHFEYWIDYDLEGNHTMIGFRMPYRYVAEMFCDRVAASKVYLGDKYTDQASWEYFQTMRHSPLIHPKTREELGFLLKMLADEGEEKTFAWLKAELKRRKKENDYYDI